MLVGKLAEIMRAEAARRQQALAKRRRTRRLIESIDELIVECEHAHLDGLVLAPDDLVERAGAAVARAGRLLAPTATLPPPRWRRRRLIDVMDVLWDAQDRLFTFQQPARDELPDEIDGRGRWPRTTEVDLVGVVTGRGLVPRPGRA